MTPLVVRFDTFDQRLASWVARHSVKLLRVSVGIVYLWFGVLKFFPGLSPAQDLAARTIGVLTFGIIQPAVAVPMLATLETIIGLGLVTGLFMRGILLLMLLQMVGAATPLVIFPGETFTYVPFVPTLEGQYIIKNIVLVSAAIVLGGTVRGGLLIADPAAAREARAREGR
jgi:uncharacterized membrane protein YkgB